MENDPAIVLSIIPISTNPGSIAWTKREAINSKTVGKISFLEMLWSGSGLMNQPNLLLVRKDGGLKPISQSRL